MTRDLEIKQAIEQNLDVSTYTPEDGKLLKETFYLGAKWADNHPDLSSLWHDVNEEPKRGSLILLIMQSGTAIVAKIIEPNHTFNHGERWAYITDLLPKGGEK